MTAVAHFPVTREQVARRLRERDVAPTEQRLEIARVLFALGMHVSAEQILAMVNERAARVSKATVYNTLKLFREKGLVREVIVDPQRVFYDPNVMPHHHFYDVDTGVLTDFSADHVSISGLPVLPEGVVEAGVEIIIRTRRAGGQSGLQAAARNEESAE
jgi:Fur family transcriptional regulator, iron response regulator